MQAQGYSGLCEQTQAVRRPQAIASSGVSSQAYTNLRQAAWKVFRCARSAR